jgi:hypothetical protein
MYVRFWYAKADIGGGSLGVTNSTKSNIKCDIPVFEKPPTLIGSEKCGRGTT